MANENSGLLIAALVAIVAVVGLVILFKGASTGAVSVSEAHLCPPGYVGQVSYDTSGLLCVPKAMTTEHHVGFQRPLGSSGEYKKFHYPGTDW